MKRGTSAFGRHRLSLAKALLRLIAHDLAQSALAIARGDCVEQLCRNIVAHEKLEASLRQALHRALPFVAVGAASPCHERHGEQLVHRMLDYIHKNYGGPMSLGRFAREIGMNSSYLSSLFSRTVGFPFRSYLKGLRLEKAQGLLSDPLKRISEIAYAVGYADPNRFRLDFKERNGLSPSAWREALVAGT